MRIVGVDIGGTSILLGVFNENGIKEQSFTYDITQDTSGESILNELIERIKTLGSIDAIGICAPGQIDQQTGAVIGDLVNIPHSTNLEIKSILETHLSVPVHVCNDVEAAALGESNFGLHDDMTNYLFVAYGTGVGGAIVRDAEIDSGEMGYAGEFGHMITHVNGQQCACGMKGCYEVYASTKALVQTAIKIDPLYDDGRKIIAAHKQGNIKIQAVVEDWLVEVVAGLVSLVHIFNPTTLVLGGGIMENDFLITEIQARLNEQILRAFRHVHVKKASLGNKAGMYGAVIFFLKRGIK